MQENQYFRLYKVLTSREVLVFRILLFVVLTLVFLLFVDEFNILTRILLLYFLLFLQEAFIHRLDKIKPTKKVSDDVRSSLMFNVRSDIESHHTTFEIVLAISKMPQGKFLLEKIGKGFSLVQVDIDKESLIAEAGILVKSINGDHIYSIDLLASYIILQEDASRELEKVSLSKNDVVKILYWVRKRFDTEQIKRNSYNGSGAFDSLIFGWTPETHHFTSDFTNEVLRIGYEPKAIGRDLEYRHLVESLSRNSAGNALLIGDPGVGKTTLVMNFAYASYKGILTKRLQNKRVYILYVDKVLSGAHDLGEVESRIGNIFTEISHAQNIIVLIENIENIFGGGGFDTDISGAIQPYLESSQVQIIGTTTPAGYKDFIASKPGLSAVFSEVKIDEPDLDRALFMLMEEIDTREKLSKGIVTFGALREILNSASVYSPDLSLPGSAANLLEDVMVRKFHEGKIEVTALDVKKLINEKTGVNLMDPTTDEKKTLLNMEDLIHEKLIGQNEAVAALSNAIRRLRSGLKKTQGPVASFLFLGPTGVGKTTAAKILAKEYFGTAERFIRVDMSEYQTQDSIKKLLGELPGEESYSDSLVNKVLNNPFALVLLDEFEKAHPRLLDIFLQIIDEGFVTNNLGKKISFNNTIIIATSNAGSEFIRQKIVNGNEDIKNELIEYVLAKGIFRPELVNRFDDVVVFHPLLKPQIQKIVRLQIEDLQQKLKNQFIEVTFSDIAIDKISNESFDPDFGARNVKRYINDNIESLISRLILEEKIKKGENVLLTLDQDNNFTISKE